jgi:3-oxoacyl-[acyl-carrier-protein] synthase I
LSASPARVVITGLGIVSVLGDTLDQVSAALQAGRSGVVSDPERVALGFSSPLTGALPSWDGGKARLSRKQRKTMGEAALYAGVAALDAVDDAGLTPDRFARFDAGVIVGNDSTAGDTSAVAPAVRSAGYTGALGAGAIFQVMNSTVTMNLSTLLGVRGANWTVSAACASGAHALGQAWSLIATGQQSVVLAGGAQEINWQTMAAFDALKAFSKRVDDPAGASRPFDAGRDGLVPSGGAALLVLEDAAHARARGARIYGEIAGYAFSSNGGHLTNPSVEAPAWCMRRALAAAQIKPQAVDYVSAHATGTPAGDRVEGLALLDVFGARGPRVSSTKSMTGHECWMAGASEILYSLLMMRDGFMAPNRNLGELDPELEGLRVLRETERVAPRVVLSNAFGFGGTNASLVVRAV